MALIRIENYRKFQAISITFCIFAENRQAKKKKMNRFGHKIRELREAGGLLLRQVAANLETDTAHISKLERGERKAKKEQAIKLALMLNADANDLLTLWLADQVYELVKNEKNAVQALEIVKTEIIDKNI